MSVGQINFKLANIAFKQGQLKSQNYTYVVPKQGFIETSKANSVKMVYYVHQYVVSTDNWCTAIKAYHKLQDNENPSVSFCVFSPLDYCNPILIHESP